MTSPRKGFGLEELVRTYFARQGFFALRGVSLRFEGEEVTDIDVWLYGKQSAGVRTKIIVDVKNKRSPKAFERILWTRGMQLVLGCDRAIVATTDINAKVARFASQQKVSILTKPFLDRLEKKIGGDARLTSEEFVADIQQCRDHRFDGDWLKIVAESRSALISLSGYQAFNKAMSAFRHFAERAHTRPQNREQAIRCAYVTASLACIALDSALERAVYEESTFRYQSIVAGVTYGDEGEGKVQGSVKTVLDVISSGMENGRAVAGQVRNAFDRMFSNVRSDIIAEHFVREANSAVLFNVGRELDNLAYTAEKEELYRLSPDAKTVVGVFADFVQAKRTALFNNDTHGRLIGQSEQQSSTSNSDYDADAEGAAEPDSLDNGQLPLMPD